MRNELIVNGQAAAIALLLVAFVMDGGELAIVYVIGLIPMNVIIYLARRRDHNIAWPAWLMWMPSIWLLVSILAMMAIKVRYVPWLH